MNNINTGPGQGYKTTKGRRGMYAAATRCAAAAGSEPRRRRSRDLTCARRAAGGPMPVHSRGVSKGTRGKGWRGRGEGGLTRSLGWMVTRFAWIAARFVSSKSETRYASDASCKAITAEDWKRRSVCPQQVPSVSSNTKHQTTEGGNAP